MLKTRLWFLLPVVYCFAAINLSAAAFLPSTFITHLEARPKLLIHISLALFSYSTLNHWCALCSSTGLARSQTKNEKSVSDQPKPTTAADGRATAV